MPLTSGKWSVLGLTSEQAFLTRGAGPAAPSGEPRRLGESGLHIDQDGPLGARRDDRLGEPVDVHVGASSVLALGSLQRHERVDAIRPDVLAVAERNHAGVALGHARPYGVRAASRSTCRTASPPAPIGAEASSTPRLSTSSRKSFSASAARS